MLNLKFATTDKLRASLSAANHVHFLVDFLDTDAPVATTSSGTLDRQASDLNTIATSDICATPAAGVRNVQSVFAINVDAAVTNTVQIIESLNATEYKRGPAFILLAGESCSLNADGVWYHYDANGGVYAVGQTFAVQSDMETGTSLTLVTAPGMIKYHPSSLKAWVSCGVAADIQQSFGVSSLTDNGTGDLTVNFSTSFSAATYNAQVSVEMTTTTYAMSAARNPHIRSGGRAVGSCRFDCIDQTTGTAIIKDPTTWHCDFKGDL